MGGGAVIVLVFEQEKAGREKNVHVRFQKIQHRKGMQEKP